MEICIKRASKKKRGRKGSLRGPRFWIVAMGTAGAIIAFTVGNSRAMNVRYALERNGELRIAKVDGEGFEKLDFKIASGRLEDVLKEFEKAAGVKVLVDNASILDIKSPGVIGRYTIDQGLSLILAGTGIKFSIIDPKNFKLLLQAEAANVEIRGSNAEVVSSQKYTEPLRDTPQTVNVIPKEVIQEQNATTLRDVLNNVPGITATAGEGGTPAGDNLNIRGFSARNDIFVDGVRDLGPQSRDPFNLEQVEVVKGPSSTFTGRGSTGGTINLVSKLPNLRRTFSGTITGGTAGTKRVTADVNVPINSSVAFRLNAMGNDSDFAGRELVGNTRWGFAPSVSFGLGSKTRFSVAYFYLGQRNISDYGIPWVPVGNTAAALVRFRDKPAPVPRDTFYGLLDRDRELLRSDLVTVRFEHDFNDYLTVRNQLRYGYSRRDSIASPGRFKNNNSTVISRELKSWITNDDIWDNQTDFTWRVKTGPISHAAVFGTSFSYEKNLRTIRAGQDFDTTMLDPNPNDIYPFPILVSPVQGDLTAKSMAAYFFDTVTFNKYFQFVGGLRWDYFGVEGVNAAAISSPPSAFVVGLTPLSRIDRIWSGRAAVVFKPVEAGSFYASYATSADPSLEGLTYSPADQRTPPESTRTLEAGTKWEFFDNRMLLTGAIFRVEKDNARTPSLVPGEPPTLDGDQRIQGFEFSATGNVTRDWQVMSAYTFLDSKILRSNTAPTIVNGVSFFEVGRRLINTPRNSFNVWSTYRWNKLFFGGGPRFVGKRFGNNINTRFIDSYWVVDAMASYQVTKKIGLQFNANNIGDKFYFDRLSGGHVVPGAGRLITGGLNFSF